MPVRAVLRQTRTPVRGDVGAMKPDLQLDDDRTALTKEALKSAFLDDLFYVQGKFPALATTNDYYMALAYAVRDRMLQRWISTAAAYTKQRLAHGRVPVGRVPDGAAPRQQPHQSRHPRAGQADA